MMEQGLHIKAQNVWDDSKMATYFEVRVFNPHSPCTSNCKSTATPCNYQKYELEKRENMRGESLTLNRDPSLLLYSHQVEDGAR